MPGEPRATAKKPHIAVFGAGAIGAYVGIRLSAAGYPVTLLGRDRLIAMADHLQACDLGGGASRPGHDLVVTTDVADLSGCAICLVTVKSADTESAGAALATALAPDTTVVSLQNGLGNVDRLRRGGLTQPAHAGLVTFNVHRPDIGPDIGPGPASRPVGSTLAKATDGPILFERAPGTEPLRRALLEAGEPAEVRDDMNAVQATKLLLNLNNGLCALTGLPIRASIRSKDMRWCLSTCIREGMRVLRASDLDIVRIGRLSPPLLARVLLLPDFLIERLAGSFMTIDPGARSSTLQDIEAGKTTEIDYLNGAIVALAEKCGERAPANRFVTEQVHRLESRADGAPPPFLDPAAVRAGIREARKSA